MPLRLSRHPLLSRFVASTLLLVAALGWLGWRLLEQDRALERQRARDVLEGSADAVVAALQRGLGATTDTLTMLLAQAVRPAALEAAARRLAPDILLLVGTADLARAFPEERLAYALFPPSPNDAPARVFARGDSLEFRADDPVAALAVFEELAASPDAAVRAGALLRIGRAARKAGDPRRAAAAYQALARLDRIVLNGIPAPLLAGAARLALSREARDTAALRRDAGALHEAVHASSMRLVRPAFDYYEAEVASALGAPPVHEDSAVAARTALTDAAASAWSFPRRDAPERASAGSRAFRVGERAFVAVWASRHDRVALLVGGPAYVAGLLQPAVPFADRQGVRITLTDDQRRPVLAGQTPGGAGQRVSRAVSDTRLPWTVSLSSGTGDIAGAAERRRLLIAGIVVSGLLALLGAYAVSRAASRELQAARLQSDFVSAVSHEFRTPLTSLRQLTELLAAGRVSTEDRRAEYYDAMRRETARLHRFVESLLDFGRSDAGVESGNGRHATLDPVALVRDTVAEFQRDTADAHVEVSAASGPLAVRGDGEALSRAVWNLLDNAVKYSPAGAPVRVELTHDTHDVVVRVRDQGMGIPPDEHAQVWEKFRRGAAARARGIRGTGIGLAIVRQVVESHGGRVALESTPGAGSAFSFTLPRGGGGNGA